MRNYESRFLLRNGKWAYIQLNEFAEAAQQEIPRIKRLWEPPDYFYHLRKGGHVAALNLHLRNPWLGKIDLSSFFNRVSRHRLTRCLKKIGYSFREAEEFAVASTVCVNRTPRGFALPYGFLQSPLLASLALDKSGLGRCLNQIRKQNIKVTVYVDDIIISSNSEDEIHGALLAIRAAAAQSLFPVNESKSKGPARSLQAFNIDLDDGKLEILADRFGEMCRSVLQHGAGPSNAGILSYVRSVNQHQAEDMLRSFPRSFPIMGPS